MSKPRYWLIVPAAGSGQRMRADWPKQYLRLDQRFVLDITLSRLLDNAAFAGCMVAIGPNDQRWPQTDASRDRRISTCIGGAERAESVLAALDALSDRTREDDWVLVHDAARPCLHPDDLARLLSELQDHPVGGLLATPVADTLKRTGPGNHDVEATVDRRDLWRALTPQMFRFLALKQALESAIDSDYPVTDEASAIEFAGQIPCIVEGRPDNIKITVPADLALAGFILKRT
ncbi:2-C-methyl-D-erythritol 4-phosphate cytidylyltransferase [Marinobacter vulgaris]|uniref:2-C-methyl-D-erythritol 4-phosphate cytidylyltransferase n=1 Tax=Marinobacter vulgaris TaxID=1928331 RepID=A0A2V3ZKU0_9GAMM|nr:2-C-methyl-D-erythritol 4-phosphate cytidylyltransferase [Marinobacter vulgaris]PXX91508.1 2-C-methyl-D-erythritol 4-phosphate cytidylyltransferase [Marinobacter vulgaris]TSJ70990.1 2-C-methyl-D-erythritol 4-phosphate cytidylyltransferase [Marinobacter vulgaris]